MSTSSKKRKLQDGPGSARAAARAPKSQQADHEPANTDPRFQLNSDFLEYDDKLDGDDNVAGPGPGPTADGDDQTLAEHRQGPLARAQQPEASDDGEGDIQDVESDGDESDHGDGGVGQSSGDGDEVDCSGEPASGPGDDMSPGTTGDQEGNDAGDQRKRAKVLSKRKLERVKEAADRRGIVYISRIPPHMKPHKLRQLLEPFGELGRVYCAPEDPAARRLRKKKGGNTGKNFTEGWVEFEDKRLAKRAALALNGQPMGGSKRSTYHYDLWTIKYLPKFKWDTLTEEINYQRAVREQRLVAEISAAKRERDFYLSRVDKAKAIAAIQERRSKKHQADPQSGGAPDTAGDTAPSAQQLPGPGEASHVANGERGGRKAAVGGRAVGGNGAHRPGFRSGRVPKADPASGEAGTLAGDVLGLLGRKRSATTA